MPSPDSLSEQRSAIRRQLLRARRSVDAATRAAFRTAAVEFALSDPRIRRARSVAVYHAMRTEAPTDALIRTLWRQGKQVFLPIVRGRRMRFVRYGPDARLHSRAIGMHEPRGTWLASSRQLDVVFLPLTGFDLQGNRLGLGGGFYDRTFATSRAGGRIWHRPKLIGLAFSVQGVDRLPIAAHDVPLHGIVTELGAIDFPATG
ncbi:5-formyltetrahydrofolate cyclo-ligase [Abyssibacter sp.]|jgi:5-formyltetrahydrofolate cyclo-ligase|uniref:5-formyltetrahydrofolate cyclo-ligase n=1 Tax=Abyssibacter sp. TaxID=2320200 RepID=UPI000C5A2B0F|nr:5-formyltetrahydrofolate cyclo-ligase [Abyssibacter sp.]MBB86389.1 5-formyltetrahydrofolate cyclo-ligase [Xanthomonadales bacterium]